MPEYIDRKTALDIIANYEIAKYGANKYLWDLIYEVPTANVVEVVRCKDCKYYQRDLMWGHGYCYGQKRKEDWFCADGRRRDDGNN